MKGVTFVIMLIGLFVLGGPALVKKFLRGYFRGVDVYVFLTIEGREVAYKNPKGRVGYEDQPLEMFPHELFYSDQFETYYNICWFDSGSLFRCGHSFHRTPQSAAYCDKPMPQGCVIGKILEER